MSNATNFLQLGNSNQAAIGVTEPLVKTPAPFATTLSVLKVSVGQNFGGATNNVLTVRKNGADTGLTLTMPENSPAGTVLSVAASVAVAAGDLLCMKIAGGASSGSILLWSVS